MQTDTGESPARLLPQDVHTRASLLQRVRDWRDDASWRDFARTYSLLIRSLALKSGLTQDEAAEVVQATLIRGADAIRDFRYDAERGSFKQWMGIQTKWKINDLLRRRQREQKIFLERNEPGTGTRTATLERFPEERNELAAFLDRDWQEAVAAAAVARVKAAVKPKHYQIFDLHAVKQWPLRRISRTLGVSVPQVYLIKSRVSLLLKVQTRQVLAQLERRPASGVPKQNTTKQNT